MKRVRLYSGARFLWFSLSLGFFCFVLFWFCVCVCFVFHFRTVFICVVVSVKLGSFQEPVINYDLNFGGLLTEFELNPSPADWKVSLPLPHGQLHS